MSDYVTLAFVAILGTRSRDVPRKVAVWVVVYRRIPLGNRRFLVPILIRMKSEKNIF